jgi:hypothetical protein
VACANISACFLSGIRSVIVGSVLLLGREANAMAIGKYLSLREAIRDGLLNEKGPPK